METWAIKKKDQVGNEKSFLKRNIENGIKLGISEIAE